MRVVPETGTCERFVCTEISNFLQKGQKSKRFDWKVISGKIYVYKIANISNDPETGKFWLLYVRSNKETKTLTHFTVGPDEVILKDEQELIFWFKTVSI
ncbi:hypothetical protein AVEN_193640-1 [Araneus ventricosus]|uniref:Uncharacterized protein n=1 Tax=Araneus ventricosus TaxID=182803 RepID=A0A4Y2HEY9_ARAVE|nr:hypothetical protein AVEN_193640-1 [Araneus ventricosus]